MVELCPLFETGFALSFPSLIESLVVSDFNAIGCLFSFYEHESHEIFLYSATDEIVKSFSRIADETFK